MIYIQSVIWGYGAIIIVALAFFSLYGISKYLYKLYRKLKYPWEDLEKELSK